MKNLAWMKMKVCLLALVLLAGIPVSLLAQKIAIIDAGSSGSRLYVYEVKDQTLKCLFPEPGKESLAKGRALSSIAHVEDSVRVYLNAMTQKYNPGEPVDLYVLATAGMRLLEEEKADAVYGHLRNIGTSHQYTVKEAMTISGKYEGLYAWLAANFNNGRLGLTADASGKSLTKVREPYGIIEFGGASMQIAFASENADENSLSRQGMGRIYSRSYLGGGVDQIYLHQKDLPKPYKFSLPLVSVSKQYKGMQFYGLGIPIKQVIEGKNEYGSVKKFVKSLTNNDLKDKYHPYMNAHYIPWVLKTFKLTDWVEVPSKECSWTEGAALDIIIYREAPEEYDYGHPN